LQSEVRDQGPLRKELLIRVEAEEVAHFIDELVGSYRQRYTLPGFRPGRAPDGLVKSRFQDEIEAAVHSELVPRSIEKALAEKRIHTAAPGDVVDLRYQPGEALTFTFRVEVWPDLEIKPYEGLRVERLVGEVTEEQVDRFLADLRLQVAEERRVERAAETGDVVAAEIETIDAHGQRVRGTKKDKVTLVAGAETLLPEFREAAQGVAAGETREFSVTYPADYHAEDLRGQLRRYRLRVQEIREKKLPPLDDEFVQKVAPGSDLEALRARVRLRLESEARMAARERLEEALVDRLIRENPFDLPDVVVRAPLERVRRRMAEEGREVSEDDLQRLYRPQIERLRRRDFLLGKAAEREGIQVSEQDVEEEIGSMARRERRTVEEVRRDIGEIERFRDFLFERRVFEALLAKVTVHDVRAPLAAPVGAAAGDSQGDSAKHE